MDHKAFDDRIREKFSGLNPQFNPDSWDDMADMLRYATPRPWYQSYQKAFWVGGLMLFSLLNFYLLWQIRSEKIGLNNSLNAPQSKVIVIDTLQVIDTLFITKTVYLNNPSPPTNQSQFAKSTPASSSYSKSGNNFTTLPGYNNRRLSASLLSSFPLQNPGRSLLSGTTQTWNDSPVFNKEKYDVPMIESDIVDPANWLEIYASKFEIKGTTSIRKKPGRKHLSNPFEARLGLIAGLSIPDPDIGERYIGKKFGLNAEFSLKRNLKFLTGLHFNRFTYKLDEVDNNNFNLEDLVRYPGYTELGKTPDEIVIENEIIQVPLHLRIYKNLNYSWSVFISGGPTVDFLLNQSFNYKYIEIDNDQLVEINEITQEKDLKIYLGNFTGSVGIEHKFNRKLAGQMSVDYQYGLGKLGVERRSVNALSLNLGAFYKLK